MNVIYFNRLAYALSAALVATFGVSAVHAQTVAPTAANLEIESSASVSSSLETDGIALQETVTDSGMSETTSAQSAAQINADLSGDNVMLDRSAAEMRSEPLEALAQATSDGATLSETTPEATLDSTEDSTELGLTEGTAPSDSLEPELTEDTVPRQEASDLGTPEVISQGINITPGRATRSGPSYIGAGGNLGLGDGDSAVGEGSFAIFSKIGLTRNISARPSVLFSDDPTILLPVTFDFIPGVTQVTENVSGEIGLRVSPFVGGGVAISTGDDSGVDFLLTGGVDVPISSRFTATATVNATLFDNTAVGLLLGLGYNF